MGATAAEPQKKGSDSIPAYPEKAGYLPLHPQDVQVPVVPALPAQQQQPLTCGGLGVQWVMFIVGCVVFHPVWWVAALMYALSSDKDPRERNGWIANCIASILTIALIIILVPLLLYADGASNM